MTNLYGIRNALEIVIIVGEWKIFIDQIKCINNKYILDLLALLL